jgi:hypothetical protein
VFEYTGKGNYVLLRIIESTRAEEKTTNGNEYITTPASGPINSEMGQTSRKTANLFGGPQRNQSVER